MIFNKFRLLLVFIVIISSACNKSSNDSTVTSSTPTSEDSVVIEVDPTYFLGAGLIEPITKVSQSLADGSSVMCYKIVSNNTPSDHVQGPWCPTNINDGIDKGGIWFEGGKLYDVDGPFIKNLATFYSNTTWNLYNSATGVINVKLQPDQMLIQCIKIIVFNVFHLISLELRKYIISRSSQLNQNIQ